MKHVTQLTTDCFSIPPSSPQNFRNLAYRAYEVQVVGRGQQPDENQWKSNWNAYSDGSGKAYVEGKAKRFNNCNGVDVLFRFKNCPSSLTRFPDNIPIDRGAYGTWTRLKCNTVQWGLH